MKRNTKRYLAAMLAAALLFTDCTEGFAAGSYSPVTAGMELQEDTEDTQETETAKPEETAEEEVASEAAAPEEAPQILFEMEELRTQTGKQYRLSDGSILAAGYGMDIHYEDEEGEWKEIDNRFLYEAAENGEDFDGYTNAEGAVEFKFAPMVQDGEILRVTQGDYFVGFQMLPITAQEEAEGAEEPSEDVEDSEKATEVSGEEQEALKEEEIPKEEGETQPELEEPSVIGDESEAFEEQPEEPKEPWAEPEKATEVSGQEADVTKEALTTELSPAPLLFLKGDVLNAEEVPAQLKELSAQDTSADFGQAETFSLQGTMQTEALQETENLPDAEEAMDKAPEVIWAKLLEAVPEKEEAELLEAMEMDKAVTCVGYGNVLPGVSLQYVLSGSSLKEYILINQAQDSYSYDFQLKLENLEPKMQEDGSILLTDTQTGEAVYEIPSAYMTDAKGAYSDAVEMEISETEDGDRILQVMADAEWINAEERSFPVQIDPTLNEIQTSMENIRGSYIRQGNPEESCIQDSHMHVGYSAGLNKLMQIYIQLRNLPALPKDSVICGASCYFGIDYFDHSGHSYMYVSAKKITEPTLWTTQFTWNSKPEEETAIMDYRYIGGSSPGTYVGWNITELVKDHYKNGNVSDSVSAFTLEAYDAVDMKQGYSAKAGIYLNIMGAYPVFQVTYRDTKGIESYYTYQTHDAGNAGVVSIGDYNSQMTLIRPAASYESTIMSYGLSFVYNSAYGDRYFINDGVNIHSKNFTTMKIGTGWKLSAQETITEVKLKNMDNEESWLIYNDSDGTEHYFKPTYDGSLKYEDEDGLNLMIWADGSTYVLKDKKDNKKTFQSGYLTKITDANGNAIHIVYNGGTAASNKVNGDNNAANRITSVYSQPNGEAAEKIFTLSYDGNFLKEISETYGNSVQLEYLVENGAYHLKSISNYDSAGNAYVVSAKYSYGTGHSKLKYVLDAEAGRGMFYDYEKSATGYRVCEFHEYGSNASDSHIEGNIVKTTADELRKTVYRDFGTDRMENTADDIVTTYLFNSSGQTININSRDATGKVLGVTASAYEANSGTSAKNNRVSNSISGGQAGVNLLKNAGFETASTTSAASGWSHYSLSGTVTRKTTNSRSGSAHYNLTGTGTTGTQMIYQTVNLIQNKTYTASVYVNTGAATAFASGGGAFVRVKSTDGTQTVDGSRLSYKTDANIDNGWQRISVTLTAAASGEYRICLLWDKAKGTLIADDMQLEMEEAASAYNHVSDGSFETGEGVWTLHAGDRGYQGTSASAYFGDKILRLDGMPGNALYAQQTIRLNKSSNTAFLLSGWSKGTSVPELEKTGNDTTKRFWGLTLTLNYSDGTSEAHDLPFSEFVREWQYAAMAVVPKKPDRTITTATLKICYYNNCNQAWFDNISLTEEAAQTYTYDDDGNLEKVTSVGNSERSEEKYSYEEGTQNLISVVTNGSGTYTYQYDSKTNPHLVTSAKNDTSTMTVGYDSKGQATMTELTNNLNTLAMLSTAAYENGLLVGQRNHNGAKTVYTYDTNRRLIASKNANEQTTKFTYDNVWNRVNQTYRTGVISAGYTYTGGNLSKITRGGYITSGGTKQNQNYGFTYDEFGNRTATSVGSSQLASYTYNKGNGTLKSMTYGSSSAPLATVSYGYDKLDRVKTVTYDDTNSEEKISYGYNYTSDGNLSGITTNGNLRYAYTYDSLGRLIYSSKLEDGKTALYTQHRYDTAGRLTGQSWQIRDDAFSESYTYNASDGTLASMKIGSVTLRFDYNKLKQLKSRISPYLEEYYLYRTRSEGVTTSQVSAVKYRYTDSEGKQTELLPNLGYTYDALGNITKITSGDETVAAQYTYDGQSQLTKEVLAGAGSYDYTYDTYGNIRKRVLDNASGLKETFEYSYKTSGWLDQLTKVTYTNTDGTTRSQSLTYDAIGNPLSYYNGKTGWTFTWKNGRQLAEAVSGSTTVTNTYDVDGTRESKTVGNVKHEYITLGGKLVREVWGTTATVDYLYDNNGSPYQVTVKEGTTTYTGYFVLNQQGDVIALVNGNGAVLVTYSYDAWGRQISCELKDKTVKTAKLYTYNRLKYRSYYYDSDLQMYDLGSRFYDPVLGRFINADGLLLAGDVLGMNLYAYCENNPVMLCDSTGTRPIASTRTDNETPEDRSTSTEWMKKTNQSDHEKNHRPDTGEPGSTYVAPNGDRRTYGPDGKQLRDYDHSDHGNPKKHPHDENGGHYHDWVNGERKGAYIPKPENITSIGLAGLSGIALLYVIGNDITGIGIGDDFLIVPLSLLVGEGMILIFE